MKEIERKGRIAAEVDMPGSKSITNRAFIIAALAEGESELVNVLESDDTRHMMEALRQFGVKIEIRANYVITPPEKLVYNGSGIIEIGNAGTATRFLTSFCSLGF